MLDKSVPYYNILMCRPGNLDVPHYDLPEGFRFSLYEEGNEKDWAEIGHIYCLVDIALREGYSDAVEYRPIRNILQGASCCESLTVYKDKAPD